MYDAMHNLQHPQLQFLHYILHVVLLQAVFPPPSLLFKLLLEVLLLVVKLLLNLLLLLLRLLFELVLLVLLHATSTSHWSSDSG